MRYRLMATYLGVPYHAGLGPDGTDVTLFSPGPPPEDLGFTAAAGHWRKQVSVPDLSALWQSRLVGEYRGEPCLVLDDLGERLHIVYLGRDAVRARQLGYWEIDREVFEVVVARDEVADLAEERVEFGLASATFPPSSPGLPAGDPLPGTPRSRHRDLSPNPIPSSKDAWTLVDGSLALIADPAPRTARPPGTARPRPNPGQRHGPRRNLVPSRIPSRVPSRVPSPRARSGPSRSRPPRRDGAPRAGTGSRLSRYLPSYSAWPAFRSPLTRSMRRFLAPCAWSRQTGVSRCSAAPRTPGSRCISSRTKKRPTSTCSACWRPKPSTTGDWDLAGQTRPSTARASPGTVRRPWSPGKTFRSTYEAKTYPRRHLTRLW